MSDPLFGPLSFDAAAALYDGVSDAFAPGHTLAEASGGDDALFLDSPLPCGLLPWHTGAFAMLLSDLPAGNISVGGARGELPTIAQTRLLRTDGHTTLLVLEGSATTAAPLFLSISGDRGTTRVPLRPTPATFDRIAATLIGQVLERTEGGGGGRPNWQPLTRHLATISEMAVRADMSLPLGHGLALLLDGDIGPCEQQPMVFAFDGPVLTARRAALAVDPQTGRSILLLPTLAARCFLLLDEAVVDVTCPPGATRSTLARTTDAMPLRESEGAMLLDLASDLALDVGPRVPDWLPLAHALGWRGADGGSIAVVGAVAVEAGTVLFVAADNREHELLNLLVRDVEHSAAPLFSVATPMAAFHPDADRHPDRLQVVLLLPRRLGAGALHVAMAGGSDAGGWMRTMDPAADRTQAILRAWRPPPPAEDAYFRAVAASVRASAARGPAIVVAEALPAAVHTARRVVTVVAFEADAAAVEQTLRSVAGALRRSIPVVIVLRSADPGYEKTMDRLASLMHTDDFDIGILVLAGFAGATAAVSTAFARLQAAEIILLDAGARWAPSGRRRSVFRTGRRGASPGMIVPPGDDDPAGAQLPRRVAEIALGHVDARLATLPAVLGDLARVAATLGIVVERDGDLAIEADAARRQAFEAVMDHTMITLPRPRAVHRGTA